MTDSPLSAATATPHHVPSIQVIVPTYNAASDLDRLLPALRMATAHTPMEVRFVDSSSTDGTRERIAEAGFACCVIDKAQFDHGGTRAMAGRDATAEIVVFLTQDAQPEEAGAIARLVAAFEDPRVAAAYGRQLPYPGTSLFGQHLRAFNYPEHSVRRTWEDRETVGLKAAFLSNSFAAYRRSAMQEIDWFQDSLILGEDTHAAARLLKRGYAIQYVAEARVYHSHSYTLVEEFRRYFDIGAFHRMHAWLLDEFGKAEGEGMRYVRSELRYLQRHGGRLQVPEFLVRNGMKYLGYRLGHAYPRIPLRLRRALSMHKGFWKH